MFFDTQIISYAMKGNWDGPLQHGSIISIVANEFLLVQGNKPTQANYYVPHPSRIGYHLAMVPGLITGGSLASTSRRSYPFRKHLTDSMIMEFKNQHSTIIEYGNFAIARVVKDKLHPLFTSAVNFLPKQPQKLILARFKFLLEREIQCIPIQREDVETAFGLLARFKEHHNLKGNFRNSWNDLLILAAAINRGEVLETKDNELSKFAADICGVKPEKHIPFLRLVFPKQQQKEERRVTSSKGYLNNGWSVRFRNLGNNAYP